MLIRVEALMIFSRFSNRHSSRLQGEPMTKQEKIGQYIAARIMRNTRKRFSTLHAELLESKQMNTRNTSATTTGMRVGDNEASRAPLQTSDDANVASEGVKASPANGSTGKNDVTSGMNVGSQVSVGVIKPTDSKTLEGSYAGDHRVTAKPAVLPENPGVRDGMRQTVAGKNIASNLPQESFPGNLTDSDQGV
jgi:hypothetical protein